MIVDTNNRCKRNNQNCNYIKKNKYNKISKKKN